MGHEFAILNFVYNTTINRIAGATPFSMVHGQECQYPIDLFYAKHQDEPLTKDGFAKWLDEQFRDAHGKAREVLGMDQRRQKDPYYKKVHGEPYATVDKVLVWAKEKVKLKKTFDPYEGPYLVMARMSEMNYKVAKQPTPSKVKFLHFNTLKRCVEGTRQPEEATARKRPTPYRSANFFDDPEMHIEDETIWLNNREGFSHDPGPRQKPVGLMSKRNRVGLEPLVNPPELNGVLRWQSDAVETFDEREMGVRSEEEAANLPNEESHQFGLVSTTM